MVTSSYEWKIFELFIFQYSFALIWTAFDCLLLFDLGGGKGGFVLIIVVYESNRKKRTCAQIDSFLLAR